MYITFFLVGKKPDIMIHIGTNSAGYKKDEVLQHKFGISRSQIKKQYLDGCNLCINSD